MVVIIYDTASILPLSLMRFQIINFVGHIILTEKLSLFDSHHESKFTLPTLGVKPLILNNFLLLITVKLR